MKKKMILIKKSLTSGNRINRSVYLLDENLKLNWIGFISENYVKRRRAHV